MLSSIYACLCITRCYKNGRIRTRAKNTLATLNEDLSKILSNRWYNEFTEVMTMAKVIDPFAPRDLIRTANSANCDLYNVPVTQNANPVSTTCV